MAPTPDAQERLIAEIERLKVLWMEMFNHGNVTALVGLDEVEHLFSTLQSLSAPSPSQPSQTAAIPAVRALVEQTRAAHAELLKFLGKRGQLWEHADGTPFKAGDVLSALRTCADQLEAVATPIESAGAESAHNSSAVGLRGEEGS